MIRCVKNDGAQRRRFCSATHVISPLIELELWDKGQANPWDVLSSMVPKVTTLGHTLTPPGQVKEKKSDLRIYDFSQITFELRKLAE